jgi:hypothetical protein
VEAPTARICGCGGTCGYDLRLEQHLQLGSVAVEAPKAMICTWSGTYSYDLWLWRHLRP